MIFAAAPALHSALALRRSPRAARPAASESLPPGILLLIRIVAGDEQAIAEAKAASAEPVEVVREASGFYLQQVLFAADASSYRVLGVDPGDDDERLREHYRWLARWLHPDRNTDAWEVVYAERVSNAWQNLRTPQRRARYDQALGETDFEMPEPERATRTAPLPPSAPARLAETYDPPPAALNLRWLPSAVLGALGVLALGVVFLYIVRMREESADSEAAVATVAAAPPVARLAPVALQAAPADEASVAPAEAGITAPTPESAPPPMAEMPVAAVPVPAPVPPAPRVVETSEATAVKPGADSMAPPPAQAAAKTSPAVARAPAAARAPAPALAPAPEPATVAAADPQPSPPPAAPRIRQADANRLLGTFSRAYENGDLQQMRELFAADAQGSKGGLREILADYDKVFDNSSERSLAVRDVNWFEDGENVTIVAGYDASITSRGGKARRSRGDLRLDLRRENDRWRIYRLRHGERPG